MTVEERLDALERSLAHLIEAVGLLSRHTHVHDDPDDDARC